MLFITKDVIAVGFVRLEPLSLVSFFETYLRHIATECMFRGKDVYAYLLEKNIMRRARNHQAQMMLEISHNLQTPLAIFQSKLETLRTAAPDDSAIRVLEDSLDELSIFIHDFLRLSRLEQSPEEPHIGLDLSTLLEDILEELHVISADRDIALLHTVAPGILIFGDTKKLRQAILGVASNAIKYMRPEGARIIVCILKQEAHTAVLSIADSGIGITPGELPHIFERFWRSKGSESIAGNGMGLAFAKHVIERHGGTLDAKSTVGHGTTMTLRIPLCGHK